MTSAQAALTRRRPVRERIIERLLFLAAALGVVTTIGIILVLAFETLEFFREVNPIEFFTGTVWSASIQPLCVRGPRRSSRAPCWWPRSRCVIAVPLGLLAAVLLAEYASPRVRTVVKPILETIAGIPTIVLGFFAINFVAPQLLEPAHREGQHRHASRRWPAGSSSGSSSRRSSPRSPRMRCGRAARHARRAPTRWARRSSRSSARSSSRRRSRGSWPRSSWR